jgi:hypothetical protein
MPRASTYDASATTPASQEGIAGGAHGASAAPLARRYWSRARTQHAAAPEQLAVAELPTRRRFGSVEPRTPAR